MNRQEAVDESSAVDLNLTDLDIYDTGFDLDEEITRIGKALLLRKDGQDRGIAAPILYGDPKGARLFQAFIEQAASKDENGNKQDSLPAQLIDRNQAALAQTYAGINRLVVIGGGDYNSFMKQEAVVLSGISGKGRGKKKELEVVLVDVSEEFLRDEIRALHDLGRKVGANYKIIPIKGDFTKVSGEKFDDILTSGFGAAPRKETMTGIISTGATFGNIQNVNDTESIPFQKIDERMAIFGEFGDVGSIIGFDCFCTLENSTDYYDARPLREFFRNGMDLIARRAEGIHDLLAKDSNGAPLFRYAPQQYPQSALLAHRLEAISPQTITVVNGSTISVTVDDSYHMMYSLRPRADHITSRPVINTGLEHDSLVGMSGLNFYTFRKTGEAAILLSNGHAGSLDEVAATPQQEKAVALAKVPSEKKASGLENFIKRFKPVLVGAGYAGPAFQ